MEPSLKKKIIAGLLLFACVLSGWLLLMAPTPAPSHHLRNVGQVDSLLQDSFARYNIPQARVSTYTTQVDSNLKRKTFVVSVPPSFPQTQFHSALKHQLDPYHIALPARVIFPEKDMHIYLSYRQTIIRTVELKMVKEDEKTKTISARLTPLLPSSRFAFAVIFKSATRSTPQC